MRATRAYLAGFGTSGSLLAGAAAMFLLASAIVAFRGWPQVEDQPAPIAVSAAHTTARGAPSRAERLLAAAAARAVSVPGRAAPARGLTGAQPGRLVAQRGGTPSSQQPSASAGTTPSGGAPSGAQGASGGSTSGPVPQVPAAQSAGGTVSQVVSSAGQAVGSTVSGVAGSVASGLSGSSPTAANAVGSAGSTASTAVSGTTSTAAGAVGSLTGGH